MAQFTLDELGEQIMLLRADHLALARTLELVLGAVGAEDPDLLDHIESTVAGLQKPGRDVAGIPAAKMAAHIEAARDFQEDIGAVPRMPI